MKSHNPSNPQDTLIAALESTDFSDESRIQRALRSELIAQLEAGKAHADKEHTVMRRSRFLVRLALYPFVLLLVVAMVILTVPSARAAAAEIIARFGALFISNAPTGAQQIVASPQADVNLGGVSAPTPNYTNWSYIMPPEEASAALGAPILIPAYVPEGYTLTLRYPGASTGPHSRGISATYNNADGSHALIVEQYRFDDGTPREMGLGGVPVSQLTVRGAEAVWAEQVPLGWVNNALVYDPQTGGGKVAPGATGPEPEEWKLNLLVWEEDGNVFRVMSDILGQDELVRVAESLSQ